MERFKRMSNIELLRIISMVFIVLFHLISKYIFMEFSINQIWANLFAGWGILGVDIFFIISIWFLREKKEFKTEKILKIILQTFFYSFGIMIVIAIFKENWITKIRIFESILPVFLNKYWFVTSYIFMYTIHIFLNKIADNIPKEILKRFVIVLTIFIPIYYTFYSMYNNSVEIMGNFGYVIYIYMYTSYLKIDQNNFIKKNKKKIFIMLGILVIFTNLFCTIIGTKFNIDYLLDMKKFNGRFSFVMLLMATAIFYIFQDLKIKKSKLINSISSITLGVYLFHENMFIKIILEICENKVLSYGNRFLLLYAFVALFAIFMITAIIEIIRINIFEKLIFKSKIIHKLCNRIDSYMNIRVL